MQGGTTFNFVTDGIEAALKNPKETAQGRDVRIGGGVATIRQYRRAGQIDEMLLAMSPVFLGTGENLFAGIDLPKLGFERPQHVPTANATHIKDMTPEELRAALKTAMPHCPEETAKHVTRAAA